MASLTIRRLDENVKAKLRVQAAKHGRSMEEEAREILKIALASQAAREPNLFEGIRRIIEPLGGVELEIPPRRHERRPPAFRK